MMEDPYPDADSEECVTVEGVGPMALRAAVRNYVAARERYENGLMMVHREADKNPATLHAADLGRLAEMEQFQ